MKTFAREEVEQMKKSLPYNGLDFLLKYEGCDPKEIGSAVGVSPQTVKLWAKGKHYPRDDVKEQLADVLDYDVQFLFFTREAKVLPYYVNNYAGEVLKQG